MRVVERRGANHGLHLVMTVLTMGLWGVFVWPLAAMLGRKTVTRMPVPAPVHQGVSGQWYFNQHTNQWVYLR